jgi:[ribosomal protein S5]-alanine N-acetyltransferase
MRQLEPNDAPGMFELDSDPLVQRYVGNQPQKSIEESIAVIAHIQEQYQQNGIGRWAVLHQTTNEFLGWCGLKLVKEQYNNQSNFYDIGYRFMPKYWGKGYATESALAWMHHGFVQLQLPIINGMADVENEGSNKVLKKIGLQHINEFAIDGQPHHWYACTRHDFLQQQNPKLPQ